MAGRNLFADEAPKGRNLFAEEKQFSTGEKVVGVGEAALSMASSLPAQAIAGLASMSPLAIPFNDGKPGTRTQEISDALTYQPRSEAGQAAQQNVAEKFGPIVEKLSGLEDFLGDTGNEIGGPVVGAIAKSIPTGVGEALGVAGLKTGANAIKNIPDQKAEVRDLIQSGSTNNDLVEFKVNEKGKVKKDSLAVATVQQGFEPGVIQAVKQASASDKSKLLKMVNITQIGRKNKRQSTENRATDVVGDSLLGRYKEVYKQNRLAGGKLDAVAKSLKDQQVDYSPAINEFAQELKQMGISVDANLTPIFKGSDIEGVKGAERVITQIMARMRDTKVPDGHDVHRLKKYIDEQVTFGKSTDGLAGKSERVLKNLRRNLDTVLDERFPEYNSVNTTYAETIGALDAFQKAAGTKINLQGANADKAVGTVMRRLMSNAQSRVQLMDAVQELEAIAKKTGRFDDDLLNQVMFADELERMFTSPSTTSLQGEVKKALGSTVDAATGRKGVLESGKDILDSVGNATSNVNEDAAFRAIRELLKSNQ